MGDVLKKCWQVITAGPESLEDYIPFGPRWLVYKKLLVLLGLLATAAVAVIILILPQPPQEYRIPTFHTQEEKLSAYTGPVILLDGGERVVYRGQVALGLREGLGAAYQPETGEVLYEGGFSQDKYSGMGILYQDKETVYEGEFAHGFYQGRGKLYRHGELLYEGGFQDGVYNGDGILYDGQGGLVYTGGFASGLYEGQGLLQNPDGAPIYEGMFQRGLYHGQGRLYGSGGRLTLEGEFLRGEPGTRGSLYSNRGQLLYTGELYGGQPDYLALLGLPMAELQKRVLELPVIYYGGGWVGMVYSELSFGFATRYDFTEYQGESEPGLTELFAQPEDNLVIDPLLVIGSRFNGQMPAEGVPVEKKAIESFSAFLASRLAGTQDPAAQLHFRAKVEPRGNLLYEVLDLPASSPFEAQGIFSDSVYYVYQSGGFSKGEIPDVLFLSRASQGG